MRLAFVTLAFIFSSFSSAFLFSQTTIAVLPFSNLDGEFSHNQWCYDLQDSVAQELIKLDLEGTYFRIIPTSEINDALSDLNIDANNPLFDAEKWKVIQELEKKDIKVDRIISGTFRIVAKRYLVNGYIYYPETQLTDPDYQAKDIFKKEEKLLEAVVIAKRLSEAFIK